MSPRTRIDAFLSSAALVAAIGCTAVSGMPPDARMADVPGLTIYNGVLALPGHDTAVQNVVLERMSTGLVIRDIGKMVAVATTDSVDAQGLYIHSANAFDASRVAVGKPGMFVLREGPSQGDPARYVVTGNTVTEWRQIRRHENAPSGNPNPAAGCYAVHLGEWVGAGPPPEGYGVVVPDTLRLHWQYSWQVGRERTLVVTDGRGHIPGPQLNYYSWRPLRNDSIQVVLGTGWYAAVLRLAPDGSGLKGTASFTGHTVPGPRLDAPIVLRRIECV